MFPPVTCARKYGLSAFSSSHPHPGTTSQRPSFHYPCLLMLINTNQKALKKREVFSKLQLLFSGKSKKVQ
jgi:hypothetical protein